ncbi:unnamed protein product, partial [Laminaria digitata]
SVEIEIRAAGTSILRKLSTPAAIAVAGAIAPCHALRDSLDACRGLPEAIRLLSSLDLFGDDTTYGGGGGGGGGGGSGGGGGGSDGGDGDGDGGGHGNGFDVEESQALSAVCENALRALATGGVTGHAEMERCISLLADLALDPGFARTLFRGGAVPQMLLNAQGCTHLEAAGASDGGGSGGSGGGGGGGRGLGSDGGSPSTTHGVQDKKGDAPAMPVLGPSGQAAVAGAGGGGGGGGGDEMAAAEGGGVVAVCRCRQAMRLLARLVRGLPGEAPAVVVRQNGLRSIVRVVEDAVAEAAAATGGPASLPVETMAATGDALELFVALSEQSQHRKALANVPGLLLASSSYAVSTTIAASPAAAAEAAELKMDQEDNSEPVESPLSSNGTGARETGADADATIAASTGNSGGGDGGSSGGGGGGHLSGRHLHATCSSSLAVTSAEESAFRLFGNLACADGPRRRIMQLEGLVLAAASELSACSVALESSATAAGLNADGVSVRAPTTGVGEAAAALLGRLAPVLGTEGSEEELIAAGEALAAAVAAGAAATAIANASANAGVSADAARGVGGAGDDTPKNRGTAAVDGLALAAGAGVAFEALSGLLVLSWSDACSLEAAAAVDGVVTDPELARSVVSLWRQATTTAALPSRDLDAGSSVVLAVMSSISSRPSGRQALVAAGATSALIDVALRRSSGNMSDGNDGSGGLGVGTGSADQREPLTIAERSELIRLLCVLCASPAHRVAVRASLVRSVAGAKGGGGSGGGGGQSRGDVGVDDDSDGESTLSAVDAAIVRIQGGGGGGSRECFAGVSRLALLLGASRPASAAAPVVRRFQNATPVPTKRSSTPARSPPPFAVAKGAGHTFSSPNGGSHGGGGGGGGGG